MPSTNSLCCHGCLVLTQLLVGGMDTAIVTTVDRVNHSRKWFWCEFSWKTLRQRDDRVDHWRLWTMLTWSLPQVNWRMSASFCPTRLPSLGSPCIKTVRDIWSLFWHLPNVAAELGSCTSMSSLVWFTDSSRTSQSISVSPCLFLKVKENTIFYWLTTIGSNIVDLNCQTWSLQNFSLTEMEIPLFLRISQHTSNDGRVETKTSWGTSFKWC